MRYFWKAALLSITACLLVFSSTSLYAAQAGARKKLLYVIQIIDDVDGMVAKLKAGGTRAGRIKEIPDYMNDHPKMVAHLTSIGFDVTVKEWPSDKEIEQADLILISEQVSGTDQGEKFRFVPVPVMCMESDLYDDLRMTGLNFDSDYGEFISERMQRAAPYWPNPAGNPAPQRFLYLFNAPHPMQAGLPNGVAQLLTSHEEMNWGRPGPAAIVIATIAGEPYKMAIFGYEKGAIMTGENIAPARRVGFCLRTFSGLSPNGVKLFDAALKWAAETPADRK